MREREVIWGSRRGTSGEVVGELPGKSRGVPEARGCLTPSQRLAVVKKFLHSWPSQTDWNWFREASGRLRFGGGTVRAVPVFGSGGSSAKKVFLCVSVQFNRKGRFRFRFRFLENGSGGSGSAVVFGKNGSDGSGSGSVPEPSCWLELTETEWKRLKLIENDRKSIEMDWKSTRIWGKIPKIGFGHSHGRWGEKTPRVAKCLQTDLNFLE